MIRNSYLEVSMIYKLIRFNMIVYLKQLNDIWVSYYFQYVYFSSYSFNV
jgi:hypothetical protein